MICIENGHDLRSRKEWPGPELIPFLNDSHWKRSRSELKLGVIRIDNFPYWLLLKMEQVWAEAISSQNWWLSLINLIENEPDLSRSEKWLELFAFLNESYWKLTRSVLDWWVVRIDSIFIENWQDLSRSEEWPELITFLNDSYWKQIRPELDRRVARFDSFS